MTGEESYLFGQILLCGALVVSGLVALYVGNWMDSRKKIDATRAEHRAPPHRAARARIESPATDPYVERRARA